MAALHRWDHLAQDISTLFGKVLRIDIDRGLFVSDTAFIVEAVYLVNRPGNYGWPL